MSDPVSDVLLLVVGAVIALLGSWARAWIDRQTAASNDLYKQRVEALNSIWRAFLPVKTIFAKKIPMGHENWALRHIDEALTLLNDFRRVVDENQVILPKDVLVALRALDTYLYDVINSKEQAPSDYLKQLNQHLSVLSASASAAFSKRTHTIDLELHR